MNTVPTRQELDALIQKNEREIIKCEYAIAEAVDLGREDLVLELFGYRIELAGIQDKLEFVNQLMF